LADFRRQLTAAAEEHRLAVKALRECHLRALKDEVSARRKAEAELEELQEEQHREIKRTRDMREAAELRAARIMAESIAPLKVRPHGVFFSRVFLSV
jgi:hypothetical protein